MLLKQHRLQENTFSKIFLDIVSFTKTLWSDEFLLPTFSCSYSRTFRCLCRWPRFAPRLTSCWGRSGLPAALGRGVASTALPRTRGWRDAWVCPCRSCSWLSRQCQLRMPARSLYGSRDMWMPSSLFYRVTAADLTATQQEFSGFYNRRWILPELHGWHWYCQCNIYVTLKTFQWLVSIGCYGPLIFSLNFFYS
jgi:hypothetical protein